MPYTCTQNLKTLASGIPEIREGSQHFKTVMWPCPRPFREQFAFLTQVLNIAYQCITFQDSIFSHLVDIKEDRKPKIRAVGVTQGHLQCRHLIVCIQFLIHQ